MLMQNETGTVLRIVYLQLPAKLGPILPPNENQSRHTEVDLVPVANLLRKRKQLCFPVPALACQLQYKEMVWTVR